MIYLLNHIEGSDVVKGLIDIFVTYFFYSVNMSAGHGKKNSEFV